jgi:hypothetical protein
LDLDLALEKPNFDYLFVKLEDWRQRVRVSCGDIGILVFGYLGVLAASLVSPQFIVSIF